MTPILFPRGLRMSFGYVGIKSTENSRRHEYIVINNVLSRLPVMSVKPYTPNLSCTLVQELTLYQGSSCIHNGPEFWPIRQQQRREILQRGGIGSRWGTESLPPGGVVINQWTEQSIIFVDRLIIGTVPTYKDTRIPVIFVTLLEERAGDKTPCARSHMCARYSS